MDYAHYPHQDYYHLVHQRQQQPTFAHQLSGLAVDVKPRLTKEQHDLLEAQYQKQNKPNTQTKKTFAAALSVSLDKVNNWFQNRRAKSKQDAKKAACQTSNPEEAQNQIDSDLPAHFLNADYFNIHNDSAVHVEPMSLASGLGISTEDMATDFASIHKPKTISPQDMNHHPEPVIVDDAPDSENRKTMTQEQFDSISNINDFVALPTKTNVVEQSPAQSTDSSFLNDYFPASNEINLESLLSTSAAASSLSSFTVNNFGNGSSHSLDALDTDASMSPTANIASARNLSAQSSSTGWSENATATSTFSVGQSSQLPGTPDSEVSPRSHKVVSKVNESWQNDPISTLDFGSLDQSFADAVTQNVDHAESGADDHDALDAFTNHSLPTASLRTTPEPPSMPIDHTDSMDLAPQAHESRFTASRSPLSSGGIAARRQRPRPSNLASGALRSTSYCGAPPTAPSLSNIGSSSALPNSMPTLRRIKSSLAVNNKFAGGRIQKNVAMPQRSPMTINFAEAMNSPKFARNLSNYSSSVSTPLGRPASHMHQVSLPMAHQLSHELSEPMQTQAGDSISVQQMQQQMTNRVQRQWAQLQNDQAMLQQGLANENPQSHAQAVDANGYPFNTFSSPPSTPFYPSQYARSNMPGHMVHQQTPPQSAPPSQQCFSRPIYPHMQQMSAARAQATHMQQQPMMPVLAHEYPQMQGMADHSVQSGPLTDLANHYAAMGLMSDQTQQPQLHFGPRTFGQVDGQHALTPPHYQLSMMPQSMLSPPQMLHQQSSMPQLKSANHADFFVHEYNPPQDTRLMTPRKHADGLSRNFIFANQGPEHYERSVSRMQKMGGSASPPSSSDSI